MGAGQTPVQAYWKELLQYIQVHHAMHMLSPGVQSCSWLRRSMQWTSCCCHCRLLGSRQRQSERVLPHSTGRMNRVELTAVYAATEQLRHACHPQEGKLKPAAVTSHIMPLKEAAKGYEIFNSKREWSQHWRPQWLAAVQLRGVVMACAQCVHLSSTFPNTYLFFFLTSYALLFNRRG